MTDCELCQQNDDDVCGSCGKPFDGYSIHYTTTRCLDCGRVYQEEYRVCEACKEKEKEPI